MRESAAPLSITESRFKTVLDRFCALVAREGITAVPYQNGGPSHFAALPAETQVTTLENFERYAAVCEEVVRNGESLKVSNQFLWRMFTRLGVRPVSDLMDNLAPGDVIEVYNTSYVQVFRSLSFFSICSYTLDELLCQPFWELFRRDQELFRRMVGTTDRLLAGEITGVHWWDVEKHSVEEIQSSALYHAVVNYKLLSPLYDSAGKVAAFVNVFRALSCASTVAPPTTYIHPERPTLHEDK